ncbi:MAG TPA: hypothetical protein VN633_22450 [Bryobacteraceae bacterium]|nr:hypothetical protein [Bryobacteraceae bacterium]
MLQKDLAHYRYLDSRLFQSMTSAVEQPAVQAERGVKDALRNGTPSDILSTREKTSSSSGNKTLYNKQRRSIMPGPLG